MIEDSNQSGDVDGLLKIMSRLRDPDTGCPWDLEQSFTSIIPHTIEETYEVADAIDKNDMLGLKDELGDLLFQIIFYTQLANELGYFNFSDVVDTISRKMIRRHPHVFSNIKYQSDNERLKAWDEIKSQENEEKQSENNNVFEESALDGVITALPALSRANKLQKRAARVGFDWKSVSSILEKIREELEEVEVEINSRDHDRQIDEIGDLLFCCVNLARKLGIDPEIALRGGNSKFERRFRIMEKQIKADGLSFNSLDVDDVLDIYWKQAKKKSGSSNFT